MRDEGFNERMNIFDDHMNMILERNEFDRFILRHMDHREE